ncbi:MAG: tetratricopeptide repeat protein [Peptococcaceae bacterium]|nr:tetratricopeptide repeat protein [Peptococcaceae bacterium]
MTGHSPALSILRRPPDARGYRSRRETARRLRIWSAGCSTGEEPYSIAITLTRAIPGWQEWDITILATDINPRFLRKAAEGIYGRWSFRGAPPWVKDKYFTQAGEGRHAILPWIKKMVQFRHLNLAEDTYPSFLNNTAAMDIIFCRNVLMYFSQECREKVVERIHRSLAEDGWLITSPAEASPVFSKAGFAAVNFPGAILFRKGSGQTVPGAVFNATPVPFDALNENFPGLSPPGAPPVAQSGRRDSADGTVPVSSMAGGRKEPAPFDAALALYEQGRYGEAAEQLAALLNGPACLESGAGAMALLARSCANLGRLDEAQEWCRKAIGADKLNPSLHYLLATILQEQGREEEARQSLARVLYLDQDFVPAHFAMGNLARQQGKPDEAARHFTNALRLLGNYEPDDILPGSGGITAGKLVQIITLLIEGEQAQ